MSTPEGIALNFAYALGMNTVRFDKIFEFESYQIKCINGHLVRMDFPKKDVYEYVYVSHYDRMASKYDLFEEFKNVSKEMKNKNKPLFDDIMSYLKNDSELMYAYHTPKIDTRKKRALKRKSNLSKKTITLSELAFGKKSFSD